MVSFSIIFTWNFIIQYVCISLGLSTLYLHMIWASFMLHTCGLKSIILPIRGWLHHAAVTNLNSFSLNMSFTCSFPLFFMFPNLPWRNGPLNHNAINPSPPQFK